MRKVSFANSKFNSMLIMSTFTMLVSYFVILSDTIIAGHIIGESGIAAINIVMPLFSFSNFAAGVISVGTVYLYCRAIGKFKEKRAEGIFGQSLFLAIVSGIVMFLLMIILKEPYLNFMDLSPSVRAEVEEYWKYEQFVILIVPINQLFAEMVYADGDSSLSIWSNITMVIGNILLSIHLCIELGTSGASLGTLIGMLLATGVLFLHFFSSKNNLTFKICFSLSNVKEMIVLTLSDTAIYICWGITGIVLNKLVISHFGDGYLPVLSVAMYLYELTILFDGVGEALSPLAQVYLGEKNYSDEKALVSHALKTCIVEGVLVMILLLGIAPLIPTLYDITSQNLIEPTILATRIIAFSMPFAAASNLMTSQYLIGRKLPISLIFTSFQLLIFVVAFSLLFAKSIGIEAIWISFVISPLLALIISYFYVVLRYGKKYYPWMLEDNEYPIYNHSFVLNEKGIMEMRDLAEEFLKENHIKKSIILRVLLLIEECGMATIAENRGKKIIAEYSLMITRHRIKLIMRDSGKIFDITKTDTEIKDISTYAVSSLMETYEDKKYVTTIQFNRSVLSIPLKK